MNYFLIAGALLLAACSNSSPEEKSQLQRPSTENGWRQYAFPLVADSLFMNNLDTTERLSYQFIRSLGADVFRIRSEGDLRFDIGEVCKIDSLKQNHAYAAYTDSLQPGMVQNAVATKIGYMAFPDSSALLIWRIAETSYEVCPAFYGTIIVGSYRNSKNHYTHVLLGQRFSWVDPPSSCDIYVATKIDTGGTLRTESKRVNDDMDVDGKESTVISWQISAEHGTLKLAAYDEQLASAEGAK